MSEIACESRCLQRLEVLDSPRARVAGSGKLPIMGTGN